MSIQFETTIHSKTPDGIVSLRRVPYTVENGRKKRAGVTERIGVVPGDFSSVAAFAPDLLPEFNKIWTPEVVQRFRVQQQEIEAYLDRALNCVVMFKLQPEGLLEEQNPVLQAQEMVFVQETGAFKIGDGETPWNELEYPWEAECHYQEKIDDLQAQIDALKKLIKKK